MKTLFRVVALLALYAGWYPAHVMAQHTSADFYVTPYYNSEGPVIQIGKWSKELAAADKQSIRKTVEAMQREMATLPAVALYVAAARLYDLGHRDEALYWFYTAQYRARVFQRVLDPGQTGGMGAPAFELKSAHAAFAELLGQYINGYAGCDQARWLAVIDRVQAENAKAPDFHKIYPSVKFMPDAAWAVANTEVNAGLAELAAYIKEHWAEMQATRKENGTDEKYCG